MNFSENYSPESNDSEINAMTMMGKSMDILWETVIKPAEENLDGMEGQRYLLFLSTDCGSTSYSCALFQRRDSNVLEFQLGKNP